MSRDKQIKEMARTICQSNRDGICDYDGNLCDFHCGNYDEATKFYNAGYRKASEVAREIFEEIEKFNRPPLPECAPVYILRKSELDKLKKKYIEVEDV